MYFKNTQTQLSNIIKANLDSASINWLASKMETIVKEQSTKDLYLTYSLIATKIKGQNGLDISDVAIDFKTYILNRNANIQQLARIYLLVSILEADSDFFSSKVASIIEVADTSELETFLKFLILLPNTENFKMAAVDALRTNISTVFNALAYHNPYPGIYFDDQQWNQMFLKTAFMQGDLSAISDIDKRANKDLARIISDYAHERWAAGRAIDPDFWRPVTKFIGVALLEDMKRLLKSENNIENRAGALCCYYSENEEAINLLNGHENLIKQIENKELSWKTLNKFRAI